MPSLNRYTFVWLPQTMVWSSSGIFACCYIGDIIQLHTFKNPQPPSKSLHNSMGTDSNAISLCIDQELSPLCSGHISGQGHHVCACRLALLVLAGVCLLGHIGLVSGADCGKQECANPRTVDSENKTESRQVPIYLSTTARASIGSRRVLRMAWSQQILPQGRCISWQAWSFQDLLHKLIKTKLDIGGGFSACLEKQTTVAPGEIHTLLLCHHTLRLQIQLVPDKHFDAILFGRVSLDLLQPDIRQAGERLSPCNIIHQDYTLCSSVVGACQRSEAFLARRVPQRQLHPLLSLVHHLQLEIHADRRRRHVSKSVGRKPYQQTALPYSWISYHQDFHQVIELHTSVTGSVSVSVRRVCNTPANKKPILLGIENSQLQNFWHTTCQLPHEEREGSDVCWCLLPWVFDSAIADDVARALDPRPLLSASSSDCRASLSRSALLSLG